MHVDNNQKQTTNPREELRRTLDQVCKFLDTLGMNGAIASEEKAVLRTELALGVMGRLQNEELDLGVEIEPRGQA